LRFFAVFFLAVFFGTFFPAALASERPIAIACLRLVTFLPDRPLFKVPALRFFITRSTSADAFFEYFRAMIFSRLQENNLRDLGKFHTMHALDRHREVRTLARLQR
jgi:hypothetical protein